MRHSPTPERLPIREGKIPIELRDRDQWVLWRWRKRGHKWAKSPYQATGEPADVQDPATWCSLAKALGVVECFDGIGFVLTEEDGYVAFDFDHCRDPESKKIKHWARELIQELNSYAEITPSGRGIRVLVCAKLPPGGRKKANFEVYDRARYVTITGRHLSGTPLEVERRDDAVAAIHARVFAADGGSTKNTQQGNRTPKADDDDLIGRGLRQEKFSHLWIGDCSDYSSQSEADLALCRRLAQLTGGDADGVDRLFRRSGLMRSKWDVKHHADGRSYGQGTIDKALDSRDACKEYVGDQFDEKESSGELASGFVFRPVDIGNLLARPPEPIPWTVPGYCAASRLTAIGGLPKIGKTTFVYHAAISVATGVTFLGRPTRRSKVLVLAPEEHREDVINRFRASEEADLVGKIRIHFGSLPFGKPVLEELIRYITHERIGMVVVDTLHAWWRIKDENSAAEIMDKGGMLLEAVRQTDAAWLCLVHARKSAGEYGLDIRGSDAFLGVIDIALVMKRTDSGDPQRCIEAVSRYRDTPRKLIVALVDGQYMALGTPEEVDISAKVKKVREALAESSPQTMEALAKMTGLDKQNVYRALKRLDNAVIREGSGKKGDPFSYRLSGD